MFNLTPGGGYGPQFGTVVSGGLGNGIVDVVVVRPTSVRFVNAVRVVSWAHVVEAGEDHYVRGARIIEHVQSHYDS